MLLTIVGAIFLVGVIFKRWRSLNKSPPGPWGLPIVGHLPLLGSMPHETLLKWKKIYGPIIFVRFGSYPTVVLNDAKLIKEAFGLSAFAGRPLLKTFIAGCEGKGMAFIDGPQAAEQRQFVVKYFKNIGMGTATKESEMHQEISKFLKHISKMVEKRQDKYLMVESLFNATVTNSLWSVIIGSRFELDGPEIKQIALLVNRALKSDSIVSKLAIFMPWFTTHFPVLSDYNEKVSSLKEIYSYVRNHIAQRKLSWTPGQPRDLTDTYFDKTAVTSSIQSSFNIQYDFQSRTTGELLMAGLDTTSTTLSWLVCYMAQNPHVQKKWQQEIDQVVGQQQFQFVSLRDRPYMPYTEAVISELLRMSSIGALGVFHRTLSNVTFHDYTIPKDTLIISNIYAVHHDPTLWDSPEIFLPERFLDKGGRYVRSEILIPFSSGRRNCIGEAIARDQLFLYGTNLFQAYHVTMDEKVKVDKVFGIAIAPAPFQAKFTRRN